MIVSWPTVQIWNVTSQKYVWWVVVFPVAVQGLSLKKKKNEHETRLDDISFSDISIWICFWGWKDTRSEWKHFRRESENQIKRKVIFNFSTFLNKGRGRGLGVVHIKLMRIVFINREWHFLRQFLVSWLWMNVQIARYMQYFFTKTAIFWQG